MHLLNLLIRKLHRFGCFVRPNKVNVWVIQVFLDEVAIDVYRDIGNSASSKSGSWHGKDFLRRGGIGFGIFHGADWLEQTLARRTRGRQLGRWVEADVGLIHSLRPFEVDRLRIHTLRESFEYIFRWTKCQKRQTTSHPATQRTIRQ